MADNENKLTLGRLRDEVRAPVETVVQKLTGELGDNVGSITVVGSALTDDFVPKATSISF